MFISSGHTAEIHKSVFMWVAANILDKLLQTAYKGCSSVLGVGRGLITPVRKKKHLVRECYPGPWTWRAPMNMVIHLRVPQKTGNFLTR